jgi:hypothetical protein
LLGEREKKDGFWMNGGLEFNLKKKDGFQSNGDDEKVKKKMGFEQTVE